MRRPMDGVLSVRVILIYIRMEASFYCRLAGAVLNTNVYRYPTWSTFYLPRFFAMSLDYSRDNNNNNNQNTGYLLWF